MQAAPRLPSTVRSRLWLDSACLDQRGLHARENGARLWLHLADGRVLAFGLAGRHHENDAIIRPLVKATAADLRGTLLKIDHPLFGSATPLYNVPPAPLPTLAWAHPKHREARAFAAGLDQTILTLLARLDKHRVWRSARNYSRLAQLPDILRRHRMQAIQRFPVLVAPILLTAHHYHDYSGGKRHAWRDHDDAVIEAIDLGRDLTSALAGLYGISRSLVRAPVCSDMWGETGLAHIHLLQLIDGIPAHRRPCDARQLETFSPRMVWLGSIGRKRANWKKLGQTAFKSGFGPAWQACEAAFPNLQHALADTHDFLRATQAGPHGEPHPEMYEDELALAWLETRGLLALLRASQRWHGQPFIPARAHPHTLGKLQPLLGGHTDENNQAREILDYPALAAEGQAMHHCVASYWRQCVERGTRIFSLTAANGERATAAYVCDASNAAVPRYRLAQLRGPRNAESSGAMTRFAHTLETLLNHAVPASESEGLPTSDHPAHPPPRSGFDRQCA